MGMYDEVVCEYPLPDGYDATGIVFQTKDLGCFLERWTITQEGALLDPWNRTPVSRSGIVQLLYTNIAMSGGGTSTESLCVTCDNQPPRVWRYTFTFAGGQVVGVSGGAEVQMGNLVSREEFRQQCGF